MSRISIATPFVSQLTCAERKLATKPAVVCGSCGKTIDPSAVETWLDECPYCDAPKPFFYKGEVPEPKDQGMNYMEELKARRRNRGKK